MKGDCESQSPRSEKHKSCERADGWETENKLEVTVIPVDNEPYSKFITIPNSLIGKWFKFF